MTPTAEQIEAGARALQRVVTRCEPHDADWRWSRTNEAVKENYRNEARECIRAAMEVSRHE